MGTQQSSILVVDDNRDYAESLVRLLEMLGYKAKSAHDGKHALAEITANKPRLVLLDIGLPDISGYSVAKLIRDRTTSEETQIVAITGGSKVFDYGEIENSGFDGCFHKPISITELTTFLLRMNMSEAT